MKANKGQLFICSLAVVNALRMLLFGDIVDYPDSATYVDAWQSLCDGHLDALRTPVYPIWIGLMQTIFGENHFQLAVIVGQHIMFVASVFVFYRIAFLFLSSAKISFCVTCVYAFSPTVYGWCNSILTEPLALALTVFYLYTILLLYNRFTMRRAIYHICSLVFLIFLRPVFVYIIPVMLVVWIIMLRKKEQRSQAFTGILSIVFTSCLLLVYMWGFQQRYGIFAISEVSSINQYYIARQYGLLEPGSVRNPQLRNEIEKDYRLHGRLCDSSELLWAHTDHVIAAYPASDISSAAHSAVRLHPMEYIRGIVHRLCSAGNSLIFFLFPFWALYLFLLIYSVILTRWIIVKKTIPFLSLTVLLLGAGNIVVIIVGAQGEWQRLALPSVPFCLLLIGQSVAYFTSSRHTRSWKSRPSCELRIP